MRLSFLIIVMSMFITGFSQENIDSEENTQNVFFANKAIYTYTTNKFNVRYIDGKIEVTNTIGSPFLFNEMVPGRLILDDKNLNFRKINYDAFQDHFIVFSKYAIKNTSTQLPFYQLNDNSVRIVNVLDRKNVPRVFIHVNSSKFIEKPDTKFMEIFTTEPSKAYILVSYKKIHDKTHRKVEYMLETWDKKYQFKLKKKYFLKNTDGFFVESKLGKSNILKFLNDKKHTKELKKFIKYNKLNLNNPADVQKFLEYYYSEILNKKSK